MGIRGLQACASSQAIAGATASAGATAGAAGMPALKDDEPEKPEEEEAKPKKKRKKEDNTPIGLAKKYLALITKQQNLKRNLSLQLRQRKWPAEYINELEEFATKLDEIYGYVFAISRDENATEEAFEDLRSQSEILIAAVEPTFIMCKGAMSAVARSEKAEEPDDDDEEEEEEEELPEEMDTD